MNFSQAKLFLLMLIAAVHCPGCIGCNLTEKVYDGESDRTSGVVHRCLNITGTNEWHFSAACWVRSLDDPSGSVIELQLDQKYTLPDGRVAAHCRRRGYKTAPVYQVCFDEVGADSDTVLTNRSIRWPGNVWTGTDGLEYTCTNASDASSTHDFDKGSRIVLYGCNSTLTGQIIKPGLSEKDSDGLVKKCIFNSGYTQNPRYEMEAIGCWLESRSEPRKFSLLAFGGDYFISIKGSRQVLGTCRKRYSREALVYLMCRDTGIDGETLRLAGSTWISRNGVQQECLPANPSELVSARIILHGCEQNTTLFPPGSETRIEDGSIWRCAFSQYKSEYGWFEAVGCWLANQQWLELTNADANIRIGVGICLNGTGRCLAVCTKRRYREEVALVGKVCLQNIGLGVRYRLPFENWTDASGIDRMCLPMADQASNFGVGAETVLRGCSSKTGNETVAPGTLFYDNDFLVYECSYNSYRREYSFKEIVGCWMHNSAGKREFIAAGEAFLLSADRTVATCRKKRYSSRVYFTTEVCFLDNQTSLLNWNPSKISFPNDTRKVGSTTFRCDPAPTYSDGVDARWIVYGCPLEDEIAAPGTHKQSEDGIIWECEHNGRGGSAAAYSWVKPVGCWFKDHLNQVIVINQFNVPYNHSALGMSVASCQYRRYSEPSLQLYVCFSQANRRVYLEGDKWTDGQTGLAKQCVLTSRYSTKSVTTVDAGCWLQAPKETNSSDSQQSRLSPNGSVAHDWKNRVLRCDFNEQNRQFEWKTSVACWFNDSKNGFTVLQTGQEYWQNGMLIYKCLETKSGAAFVQHSCNHNGTWHAGMSTWRDVHYKYKCLPASGDRKAEVQKTHCITDEGKEITESKKINGVQYVCMNVCGFLFFFREPTPEHYRLLFSFINNCHAVNMNIINSIG